jgi:hypothetical protein
VTDEKPRQQLQFLDSRGRKPQQRWITAAQARADAKAHFEALPAGVRTATIDHLHRMLREAHWRFAASMPENPHEYTHSRTWPNRTAFVWTAEMVRLLGVRERYAGRLYTVYFCGGFKHWTMNWPMAQTILINRKPESEPAPSAGESPETPSEPGTRRIDLDDEP